MAGKIYLLAEDSDHSAADNRLVVDMETELVVPVGHLGAAEKVLPTLFLEV